MAQDLIQKAKEHILAFNAKDWNRYKSMMTDQGVYEEEATHQRLQGHDKIVEALKRWTTAFPDLKGTAKEAFSSGNRVVMEIVWEGTHNGPLAGPFGNLPATGKRGQVSAVEVVTFDGDKISEIRHYFDLMTILRQVGVSAGMGAPQPSP